MVEISSMWDPNEWELHVFALLRGRHGPLNIHKVPARHKGDHGIDYYSLEHKVVYQCYAVEEPCDVATRAQKQKAKMRTDLDKFRKNGAAITAILGGVKISHWVLVVPLQDSADVNMYAGEKTQEFRNLRLPYVTDDFVVAVQDLDTFDQDLRSLVELQRRTINIPKVQATHDEVQQWVESENGLVEALTRKLRKRVNTPDLNQHVEEFVSLFLERENSLQRLRENAPMLYEPIMEVIQRHSRRLRAAGLPQEGSPGKLLLQAVDELVAALKESVPNLSTSSADDLAMGTVADWLMRCPLDFPPHSHEA